MTTLNPDHLLDQAGRLAASVTAGHPRQVDLRRAISSAYYAVFHLIVNFAGDLVLDAKARGGSDFALVVRSISHSTIKKVCIDLSRSMPPAAYQPYLSGRDFDSHILDALAGIPTLQDQRHAADYDVGRNFTASDARTAIETAHAIFRALRRADEQPRKLLLLLILFPPKR